MRRVDLVVGVLVVAFSVWFAAHALARLSYWGPNGPGPAFLPAWLGGAMAILGLCLVGRAWRHAGPDVPWLPRGRGLTRLVVVVAAIAGLIALLPVVGMTPGVALFLVGILKWLEGYRWRTAVSIAVAVASLNYVVFTYWLSVPFPVGILGF